MKMRKWLGIIVMVLAFPLMTGCWDRLEIEDRATILGLAIDPVEDGPVEGISGPSAQSEIKGYKLTAQLAIPGRIPLGPSGAGGTGEEKPVWVITTTGKTMQDAMSTMQQELADKVFLGHLRVIIVNQRLARNTGLNDVQDFFRRNAEIRRLAWMVVSEGNASVAMEAAPKLERVPTLYLVGTMDHAVELGKLPNVFLGNFWSTFSSKGQEPVLPMIDVSGDKIELKGVAVFSQSKMVGELDPLETAAFMEITNVKNAGYPVAVPFPGDATHSVIIRGTDRKSKIKLKMEHGKVTFDVYSFIEANILERTGTKSVDTVIPQIEAEVEKSLMQGQMKTITKMQQLHSDIFGFGEYVRGHNPNYWTGKLGESRKAWEEEFANVPIHVHTKIYIRRSGMAAH